MLTCRPCSQQCMLHVAHSCCRALFKCNATAGSCHSGQAGAGLGNTSRTRAMRSTACLHSAAVTASQACATSDVSSTLAGGADGTCMPECTVRQGMGAGAKHMIQDLLSLHGRGHRIPHRGCPSWMLTLHPVQSKVTLAGHACCGEEALASAALAGLGPARTTEALPTKHAYGESLCSCRHGCSRNSDLGRASQHHRGPGVHLGATSGNMT